MGGYESYLGALDAFWKYTEIEGSDRNEATTRLQLIDRLFFDCLGWSREAVVLEQPHGGEYSDYVFGGTRQSLVVEAKREGVYFEVSAGLDRIETGIPALVRGNDALSKAIDQVSGYCQRRGVPLGVVSNGHQLVCLIANRTDGVPPNRGRALVFSSPQQMVDNALDLWNALSPPGVEEKTLQRRLLGDGGQQLPQKLSTSLHDYPGIKGRNVFQTELQIVSEVVLEDVARHRDIEATFLKECYCQSGALSQYALISKELLHARYSALFGSDSPGPTIVPISTKDGVTSELLSDHLSTRPVLIIGDVGVGKTSFIRNLIKVEASAIFETAIGLYLDLGTQATLTQDVRAFVLDEVALQLREDYRVDVYENTFVRDVYRSDLQRFSRGIYANIAASNPELYKLKEVEFLEEKLRDVERHLRASVHRIATSYHKQVVVFLDNADQRDDETQQKVFLIAQELAAHWNATVFMTLRPETFHKSLKEGAISGYHPKAFTVLPPRIDRVLESRLRFALKIAKGEIAIEYLGGVKVHLGKLQAVLQSFLQSLTDNRDLVTFLENLAAGNVRLALDLARGFFGSGHVDTKKIVEIYERQKSYTVPLHEFLRAVVYGDSIHYDPSRSPIANLFDVSSLDPAEHFLVPVLIGVLARWTGPGAEDGFVETLRLYERLQGLGFMPDQIDLALVRSHSHKLVESAARRAPTDRILMPAAFRATTAGVYHIERLCRMFQYLDAVVVDLPILDSTVRDCIHDARNIDARLSRASIAREYLDKQWESVRGRVELFDWPAASAELAGQIRWIESRLGARRAQLEMLQ